MCLATKKQEEGENAALLRYDLNGRYRPRGASPASRALGGRRRLTLSSLLFLGNLPSPYALTTRLLVSGLEAELFLPPVPRGSVLPPSPVPEGPREARAEPAPANGPGECRLSPRRCASGARTQSHRAPLGSGTPPSPPHAAVGAESPEPPARGCAAVRTPSSAYGALGNRSSAPGGLGFAPLRPGMTPDVLPWQRFSVSALLSRSERRKLSLLRGAAVTRSPALHPCVFSPIF